VGRGKEGNSYVIMRKSKNYDKRGDGFENAFE
jgi:hypothetical protein